jgi:hypothetical protein
VDAPSFISSFRSFRRVPTAALFATLLFVIAEVLVALLWRPGIVGEELYTDRALAYDYGYGSDVPRLFREGEFLHYYPTEYVDIRPFRVEGQKPASEIRIFTLGTSVTRAYNLPFGAAYSERLEAMLNERHPEFEWKIVNLSASGFGSTRMLNVLRNTMKLEPDLLVVHPHGSNEYEDERDAGYRRQLHSGLNGVFLRSRLLVLLKKYQSESFDRQQEQGAPDNGEHLASSVPENRARWMRTMESNLDEFDRIASEHGIPLIYIGRAERDIEASSDVRVARLNGPLLSRPYVIDVDSLFTQVADENSRSDLFSDLTHYAQPGHEIVAARLYELIRPGGPLFDTIVEKRAEAQRQPPR